MQNLRKGYEKDNHRRLERMRQWLACANKAADDTSAATKGTAPEKDKDAKTDAGAVRFIFYWIAFEAAFETQKESSGKQLMKRFIKRAVKIDGNENKSKFNKLLDRNGEVYQNSVELLSLRVTHEGFWKKPSEPKNREKWTHEKWERLFNQEMEKFPAQDKSDQLCVIFNRIRVVRHQIFHGASSMKNSKGQQQVAAGLNILSIVIPAFYDLIDRTKGKIDWKPVPYPRVKKGAPPIWEE